MEYTAGFRVAFSAENRVAFRIFSAPLQSDVGLLVANYLFTPWPDQELDITYSI